MGTDRRKDRHKAKPFQLRLHPLLREQLEELADKNLTTLTTEVVAAIRDRLTSFGLWPPPPKPKQSQPPHTAGEDTP